MGTISSSTAPYLETLRDIAHTLSGSLQESDVVQLLLEKVMATMQAQGVILRLLSPDGDELWPAGALGLSERYLDKGPVRLSQSEVDQRVMAGEVVTCADVTCTPGFQYPEAAAVEGLRGMISVPLTVRGRVIGVLRVYMEDIGRIQPDDVLLLSTVADLGALALEKVRLHQGLLRIAEALNSTLELRDMLQRVLEVTVSQLHLKAGSIRLLDPKGRVLRLAAAYGLSQAYLAKGDVHVDKSPVDQRVLAGETVVLFDVEREPGFEYPAEAAREGIRSVLVVPLVIKDRPLGVMRAYSARPRHFGPVAINFLRSAADLVALAIENAQLYASLRARYEDLKIDLADWYRFLALG
ncbi:MAG: GAF domain-containing protein [Anaerolineae bacterium]